MPLGGYCNCGSVNVSIGIPETWKSFRTIGGMECVFLTKEKGSYLKTEA